MNNKSHGKTELKTEEKKLLFILEESIPVAQEERKKYVSDIAFFYSTVFKQKLKHFIGMQLEALATEGRPVVSDQFIRCSISCFRLIDEWCETMTNEHIGNMTQVRNSLDDNKIIINEFDKKYGK